MSTLINFLSFFEPFVKDFFPNRIANSPFKFIIAPLVVAFCVYCVKDLFLLRR